MIPFSPVPGGTVNIDVSSTSQAVQVTTDPGITQLRLMNNGTATVWVRCGGSTVTAVATSGFPVAAGTTEVLTIAYSDGPLYAAAIAAASTGKIYFTPGRGI